MIGIVVDTNIIKQLINIIMPQLGPIFEEKTDFLGDIIGSNFINRGLTNLFSNEMIDESLLLLIWDYLFLEGNTVLIKAFLAIYSFLSDKIIKGPKTLEFFLDLINNEIKKIKLDNDDFIYNLFFEYDIYLSQYDFNSLRFENSLQIAEKVEEQNIEYTQLKIHLFYDKKLLDKQMGKISGCNKKWPYCINDTYFENVTKIVSCLILQESDKKYINNYFFSDSDVKEKNKEEGKKEIDYYNIKIERRPHYCDDIQSEIKSKDDEGKKQSEIKENKNDIENDKKSDSLFK